MKIWQIKDRPNSLKLNEEELIEAISNGLIDKNDILINTELNIEMKLSDCIYSFYLRREDHE